MIHKAVFSLALAVLTSAASAEVSQVVPLTEYQVYGDLDGTGYALPVTNGTLYTTLYPGGQQYGAGYARFLLGGLPIDLSSYTAILSFDLSAATFGFGYTGTVPSPGATSGTTVLQRKHDYSALSGTGFSWLDLFNPVVGTPVTFVPFDTPAASYSFDVTARLLNIRALGDTNFDFSFTGPNAQASSVVVSNVALTLTPMVAAVPEPQTYALMLGGLAFVAGSSWRGRARQRQDSVAR